MLDIIIYSNNITTIKKCKEAVSMALINYEFEYNIFVGNDSNIISNNKKIYIIDVLDKDNKNIPSIIREYDFKSIIILVNTINYNMRVNKRLMILDFVLDNDNFIARLREDIDLAIRIIYGSKIFVFRYNHVIYRIPYIEINYIEKEPAVKRCIIHTSNKEYYIVNSIENIGKELDICFMKTHQSCIINKDNVRGLDVSNNVIFFKNGDYTSLLTNKVKKSLKEYIEC